MSRQGPQNLCPDPCRLADVFSGVKPHVVVRRPQQKKYTITTKGQRIQTVWNNEVA